MFLLYCRYVSHEIRTPLNTVFLGLDLVEQRLISEELDIKTVVAMVQDLRESSLIATEILNDLLNYEKLEAGLMRLETSDAFPIPFILKALHPFKIQAEQKQIELHIVRNEIINSDCELRNWRIFIDEVKMGQVRNRLLTTYYILSYINGVLYIHTVGTAQLHLQCTEIHSGAWYR
jgi:signal transduction histidine kinase